MNVFRLIKTIGLNRFGVYQLPSFVTYLVTWRCNGRCGFCDVWKKRADGQDELSLAEIARIFRQIRKPDAVRITGGEPFLRQDLAAVINAIDEVSRPSMIHITSNGLLPERIVAVMSSLAHPRKVHIKISIDRVGEGHDRIRGVPGAYAQAMRSVQELVRLRPKYKFQVGINQAIVDESDIEAYERLKEVLKDDDVPIYRSIAFEPHNSLYSGEILTDPQGSIRPFGTFSPEGLELLIGKMIREVRNNPDRAERMVDRYHLKGMYNRMVRGKAEPAPRCVALNNHIRILPNGDVPVCLYNGQIVGNLRHSRLREIWDSPEVRRQRAWVRACPGCWQSCESAVSAVYTGDIRKGWR